jgi:hypothetical protein
VALGKCRRGMSGAAAEVEHAGAVKRVPTSELLEHGVVATRPPTHVVGDVPQTHDGEANRPCWLWRKAEVETLDSRRHCETLAQRTFTTPGCYLLVVGTARGAPGVLLVA